MGRVYRMGEWLRPKELAQALHVHPKTLSRWVQEGKLVIPHFRTFGGHRRYDPAVIEQVRVQVDQLWRRQG